jgi:hypothetical protein
VTWCVTHRDAAEGSAGPRSSPDRRCRAGISVSVDSIFSTPAILMWWGSTMRRWSWHRRWPRGLAAGDSVDQVSRWLYPGPASGRPDLGDQGALVGRGRAPATRPPYANWPTASSASCTAASRPAPTTTNRPPGTTSSAKPLDSPRTWDVCRGDAWPSPRRSR